jgi:Flp pilus assembly pilin Flp
VPDVLLLSSSPGTQFRHNGSQKAVIAIMRHIKRLRADESGATAIEYGLITSAMGFMLLPFASFFSSAFSDWAVALVAAFSTVMGW